MVAGLRMILAVLVLLLLGVCTPAHAAAAQTYSYGPESGQRIEVTALAGTNPWVMVVHGGSWAAGNMAAAAHAQQVFTAAGFVVFNIDYRKITDYPDKPGVPWSEQRDDVVAALDWARAHADQFGADPDRGAIYGFSAGGHLAASAGLYDDGLSRVKAIVSASGVLQPHRVVNVADSDPSIGWAGDKPTVANRNLARWEAVAMRCPMITWTDCAARWNDFKPETHISSDDPPIYMAQGTADTGVPPQSARSFQYWMHHAGLEAVLVECVGWGHTETCALDGGWRQAKLIAWLKTKTA